MKYFGNTKNQLIVFFLRKVAFLLIHNVDFREDISISKASNPLKKAFFVVSIGYSDK